MGASSSPVYLLAYLSALILYDFGTDVVILFCILFITSGIILCFEYVITQSDRINFRDNFINATDALPHHISCTLYPPPTD